MKKNPQGKRIEKNLIEIIENSLTNSNKTLNNPLKNRQYKSPDTVFNDLLRVIIVRSKKTYTIKKLEDSIILNLLSKHIKSSYKLSPPNRDNIVKNLINSLKKTHPYNIHRYDIKSFYESIDRPSLLQKIKNDGILSQNDLKTVEAFFKELDRQSIPGLPRGLGISTTLSEIALIEMNQHFTNAKGIFLYERFVDDIILITDTGVNATDSQQALERLLPSGLELHKAGSEKNYFGRLSDVAGRRCSNDHDCTFSYLGFSYIVHEHLEETECTHPPVRKVRIDISPDKVLKIKNRIIKSLTSYISSPHKTEEQYELLIKRLKFLTGNYNLYDKFNERSIKSGIYYNYKFATQPDQLIKLDRFFKSLLFSMNSNLSKRIQSNIPVGKRRELAHFSFKKGFQQKRFHKLTRNDFFKIKKIWQ